MKDKIELLAPAGDWDAFVAAVENGADAIYLGGKLFNARQFAANFEGEQLKKALDYAHVRGVNVYLTMNTLTLDSEMRKALDLVEEAYTSGIDGIIVQDIGLAGLLGGVFPDLPLHGSTQMTIYNLEGVNVLEKLGFKRVVLARELPMEEIRHISQNTALEVEVFVHGALCVCYSGQCLMSSIIGGRSGNRGKCAQPCRLKYQLVRNDPGATQFSQEEDGYLLSPRDLCTVNLLGDIAASGVKSLKIEGRMKSPEYVATVVRVYRKYLDAAVELAEEHSNGRVNIEEKDMKDLTQIFNRGAFSTGYFAGKKGRDMMAYEKPKNWGIFLGNIISYDRTAGALKIRLQDELSIGDGIEVWNGEEESPGTVVSEIKIGGKRVDNAAKGDVVSIGSIKGRITPGCKVYRTSSKRLNVEARESFSGKFRKKIELQGEFRVENGKPMALYVDDNDGNHVEVLSSYIPEAAVNRPLTDDRAYEQLNKTGSTPFEFGNIKFYIDEGLSVPVSEINNIRRSALEEIEKKRADVLARNISKDALERKEKLLNFEECIDQVESSYNDAGNALHPRLSLYIFDFNDAISYSKLKAERIYVPFNTLMRKDAQKLFDSLHESNMEVFIWLPSITRGNYNELIMSRMDFIGKLGVNGLLIGNLGSLEYAGGQFGLKIAGDHAINIFNSFAACEMSKLKLDGITLSPEINLSQLAAIKKVPAMEREAVVYGRLPLMTSEYCPVGSTVGGFDAKNKCNSACTRGSYSLRDRKGMEFPVLCDRIDCRSVILNSNVLFTLDSLNKIAAAGVDILRFNMSDETEGEMAELLEMHREALRKGPTVLERHSEAIERIKSKGFTKGHYFRGV